VIKEVGASVAAVVAAVAVVAVAVVVMVAVELVELVELVVVELPIRNKTPLIPLFIGFCSTPTAVKPVGLRKFHARCNPALGDNEHRKTSLAPKAGSKSSRILP
jgi:hypothetical protein